MLSTLYSNNKLNNGSTKSNNDFLPKLLPSTPELPTALPHGSPELTLLSPASRLNSMLALPRKTQRLPARIITQRTNLEAMLKKFADAHKLQFDKFYTCSF